MPDPTPPAGYELEDKKTLATDAAAPKVVPVSLGAKDQSVTSATPPVVSPSAAIPAVLGHATKPKPGVVPVDLGVGKPSAPVVLSPESQALVNSFTPAAPGAKSFSQNVDEYAAKNLPLSDDIIDERNMHKSLHDLEAQFDSHQRAIPSWLPLMQKAEAGKASPVEVKQLAQMHAAGQIPPTAKDQAKFGSSQRQVGETKRFNNGKIGRWDGHGWVQQ